MIEHNRIMGLKATDKANVESKVASLLLDEETVYVAFLAGSHPLVFTDKRIIAVTGRGTSDPTKDYISFSYKKIAAYSITDPNLSSVKPELEIWVTGFGQVKFEFMGEANLAYLNKLIGWNTL